MVLGPTPSRGAVRRQPAHRVDSVREDGKIAQRRNPLPGARVSFGKDGHFAGDMASASFYQGVQPFESAAGADYVVNQERVLSMDQ